MLVLTRREGESIVIGDDIEITLLSIDASKVRLGIQAPLSVPVHRREIYVAIHATNEDDSGAEPADLLQARHRRAS